MDRHADLLGLLCIVAGAVAGLAGLALLPLAAAALALRAAGEASPLAAAFTGVLFAVLAGIALVYAAASVVIGRGLRRHERWARTAALVLAPLNLLVPPFGTALGGYALWVLLRSDASAWRTRQTAGGAG
ncbi:MAG TPA: hypothetical protein VIL35_05190 [Vicinamibacterales bacterium]